MTAAVGEDLETTVQGTAEGLNGWIRGFDKTRLAGVVFAGGVMGKARLRDIRHLQGHSRLGMD